MPDSLTSGRWHDAAQELMHRCDELARCSEEPGRLTRTFLCDAFHQAHDLVRGWMERAGLETRTDAAGNLIGRLPSDLPDAPIFLVGSHLDTVPDGGRYDGILGVLAGIALAEDFRTSGFTLPFHLEVIAFSEEEGVRFRLPFLGSLAVTGGLTPEHLEATDRQGTTVGEAISQFGLSPEQLPAAAYRHGSLLGFLEIHIEQGPVLEQRGVPLGVVTGISGQTRLESRIHGETRHAGTTPMPARRDALAAAADLVLMTESLAHALPDLVATVGSLDVHPNASNCIPGAVALTLDLRHPQDEVRTQAVEQWLKNAASIARGRGVEFEVLSRRAQAAVPSSLRLREALERAAVTALRQPLPRLASGAGHDAMILARIAPMALLFVRCRGGISHSPDESIEAADVAAALAVGAVFLRSLAAESEIPLELESPPLPLTFLDSSESLSSPS